MISTTIQIVIVWLATDCYSALENIINWIFIAWLWESPEKGFGGIRAGYGWGSW